jgi:hypothetical protein
MKPYQINRVEKIGLAVALLLAFALRFTGLG